VTTTLTVKVDEQGRLTIPPHVQRRLGIKPGDSFVLECDDARRALRFTRAESPFDILVERALAEHQIGLTRGPRDYAADQGLALDAG
jgi:AbrB family looped-hinge helix DNA binding protein